MAFVCILIVPQDNAVEIMFATHLCMCVCVWSLGFLCKYQSRIHKTISIWHNCPDSHIAYIAGSNIYIYMRIQLRESY